ncbi:DUF5462 family protein [Salmonella enterica]
MVQNNIKAAMAGMLITAWAVACPPAAAQDTEKMQHLGVVNGQVKDNQVVEVTRTLTDPVLYKVDAPEALPQTLRVRNATARRADNGAVWVTTRQVLAGQQVAGVTTKVTLWADGKSEPAVFTAQGTDVLISLPQDMTPRQQVMLRSDSPVTLQVPANWRGSLQVPLEITGE